jgi:hypothetical protein
LPVAALAAVAGIAAAVWASAPAPSVAVDWRHIEQLCFANGGYYYRTDGGGACIDERHAMTWCGMRVSGVAATPAFVVCHS